VQGARVKRPDFLLLLVDVGGPEVSPTLLLSARGGALSPAGRPEGPSASRLTGAVLALLVGECARAPSRISVHDPAVWRAGDMMVDGVTPLG
jgi:hypothetical protein